MDDRLRPNPDSGLRREAGGSTVLRENRVDCRRHVFEKTPDFLGETFLQLLETRACY
jgi:hypothetical protein